MDSISEFIILKDIHPHSKQKQEDLVMQEQQIISKYYCGVDVHPRNSYFCVMDALGNIKIRKNIKNNFDVFKDYLNPFLPEIVVGCESTYCYYWLADGCHEAGNALSGGIMGVKP